MEMFLSNHSVFSIQGYLVQEHLHQCKWSSGLQIQRCHLNPWSHSKRKIGNLNMDMGMGIVHVVMNVHVYIVVCQEFLQWSNVHHPMKQFGSPLLHLLQLPVEYKCFGCALKTVIVDHVYDPAPVMHCKGKEPYLLWCHHHQRSCMLIFCAQV